MPKTRVLPSWGVVRLKAGDGAKREGRHVRWIEGGKQRQSYVGRTKATADAFLAKKRAAAAQADLLLILPALL